MCAVITHHPQPTCRHLHRSELVSKARIYQRIRHHGLGVQIWLVQRFAVNRQTGVDTALNCLTTSCDDSLHQIVFVGRYKSDERQRVLQPANNRVVRPDLFVRQIPVRRSFKHDHVARLGFAEAIGEFVDHDPIANAATTTVQRRLH